MYTSSTVTHTDLYSVLQNHKLSTEAINQNKCILYYIMSCFDCGVIVSTRLRINFDLYSVLRGNYIS